MIKIICILFLTVSSLLYSQTNGEYGEDEKLGNALPMDAEFFNEKGEIVRLGNIIKKPSILAFIYYNCPTVCNPLLAEVANVVNKLDFKLGEDYQIISLSFDHNEKPELAKQKRPNYIAILNKPVTPDSWFFLTGDSLNIHKVTSAAGFYFRIAGNEYAHPVVIMIIDKNGRITRYLYGNKFLPFDFKMGLIEAAEGRIGPTVSSRFLNFCYNYDPNSKNYNLSITRITGLISIFVLLIFAIYLIRIKLSKKRRNLINDK